MESLQSDNQRILKEARAEKETLLKEARITRSELINGAKEEAQDGSSKNLGTSSRSHPKRKACSSH